MRRSEVEKKAGAWLERWYIGLHGPHSVVFLSDNIMNFVDDYLGFNWTRLLKANSDVFSAFARDYWPSRQTDEVLR